MALSSVQALGILGIFQALRSAGQLFCWLKGTEGLQALFSAQQGRKAKAAEYLQANRPGRSKFYSPLPGEKRNDATSSKSC